MGACDDVHVVNHDDLIARLRALSNQPVDDRVAHAHLDRATAAAEVVSGRRRWPLLAACVAALIAPAAGIVAARASSNDGDPTGVVDQPVGVSDEFVCTGPPPFAGPVTDAATTGDEAAARRAQVLEYAEWRATNCSSRDTTSSIAVDSTAVNTSCSGPPPFAGSSAEPADPDASVIPSPRAAEAAALAEVRSGCPDTTTTMVTTSTTPVATTTQPTPTSSATVSPAENVAPASQPEDLPGPPDGVPAGPPEDVPGQSDGVPGRPDGVPAGPPEDVPGQSDGVPGRPDGVPAGSPDGVPGQGGGRSG
jgi:hypothetical protein